MDSETTPDHYKALGVDKQADAATIKSTYRKLVLKCHPDKVTDPALKEQKQEEFHQIQQAYECLSDEQKRSAYDMLLTVEKLRREKAARGPAPRDKNARFDVPTSSGARYTTEDRVPTQHSSDDRYQQGRDRERARYQSYTTKSAPTPAPASRATREKEPSSRSTRHAKEDRARAEREKPRAKEVRPERKFAAAPEDDSSADEKDRYEAYEAAYKARAEQERRKTEERRSYEDNAHAVPTHRKMSAQAEEALRYQHKSRAQVEEEMMARPSPQRTASRDYYTAEPRPARRESSRPEPVRRSSARPGKDRPSMSRRDTDRTDRGIPEVMEWAEERRTEERRPPAFKQSTSSPVELGRGIPQRSFTERLPRHGENIPQPPAFLRSSTMPSVHSSSSRRKESAGPRPSGLREGVTSEQYSSPERDAFPTVPPPQTPAGVKTTYYYPVSGGGVSVRPEEVPLSAPRHVVREPKPRHRSPSPLGKPPIGANRPVEPTSSYKTAPRPGMSSRTESSRNISPIRGSEERGRSGRLYGEVGADPRHRVRQPSFDPDDVQYSRRYGPEDVRWAPRSGEPDRGYASKPTISRTATYVY